MSDKIYDLTVKDFADLLSVSESDIPPACIKIINNRDFRYTFFDQNERDRIILDMIKKIDFKKYTISGENEKERWEKGWQENLDNFIDGGYNKKSLVPQYIRNGLPIRLYGDYVKTCDEEFEINFIDLIITFVFHKYLKDKDAIYEFGCGPCYNLLSFAQAFPEKYYCGCDWVEQSKKITEVIRDHYNFNMNGEVFNMFYPTENFNVKNNSAAFTLGSLEQLGEKYDSFIDFLFPFPPSATFIFSG